MRYSNLILDIRIVGPGGEDLVDLPSEFLIFFKQVVSATESSLKLGFMDLPFCTTSAKIFKSKQLNSTNSVLVTVTGIGLVANILGNKYIFLYLRFERHGTRYTLYLWVVQYWNIQHGCENKYTEKKKVNAPQVRNQNIQLLITTKNYCFSF